MDKPRVFISHSALDADWARLFAQALQQRGVPVWFDEFDVHPGESLREALESGLRGSDVFVALLDLEYPAKPALFFELGAAIGNGEKSCTDSSEGSGSEQSSTGRPAAPLSDPR
jgi:TIR domain